MGGESGRDDVISLDRGILSCDATLVLAGGQCYGLKNDGVGAGLDEYWTIGQYVSPEERA